MNTPGSSTRAAGLAILLISVGAGIGTSCFSLLPCFAAVLAGASLVAVGVRVADDVPAVFDGDLAAFLRRHLAAVGIVVASSAVTAVSGDAGPVLCFSMFALLLLGLCLINIGALGEH
ncbi:unnamed protein product [Urochloa humidicola]